jgi:hypothetical protein
MYGRRSNLGRMLSLNSYLGRLPEHSQLVCPKTNLQHQSLYFVIVHG